MHALRGDRPTLALLSTIVLVCVFISSVWLYRVPFMQETDEQAHVDYAYALYNAGGWFASKDSRAEDYVTPQVQYLVRQSNFWAMRMSAGARAPVGYGSKTYYERLDRAAPRVRSGEASSGPVPYVAFQYPPGYYVIAARAMQLASAIYRGSLTSTYFAARALGILFLGITLILSFCIFRLLRIAPTLALGMTAAMGLLPLTSWVSSYVQPDTLMLLMVTLVIYLTLLWRYKPFSPVVSCSVVLTLAAAFFVKQHYALALTAAVAVTVASYLPAKRKLVRARLLGILGAAVFLGIAWLAATQITPIGPLRTPTALHAVGTGATSLLVSAARFVTYFAYGAANAYLPSSTFRSFWLSFGDLVTPYIAYGPLLRTTENALGIVSAGIAFLLILRQIRVSKRLASVWQRHPVTAYRLAFSDIVLNVYVIWVILLLGVFAASAGQVYLEGRYFLPVLLPTLLLSARYAPSLFAIRSRRIAAAVATSAWLAFGATMSPVAIAAMNQRFYGSPQAAPEGNVVRIVRIVGHDGSRQSSRRLRIAPDFSITVFGDIVATRPETHLRGIRATLDGIAFPVDYGYQRGEPGNLILRTFSLRTPDHLTVGVHKLRIAGSPSNPQNEDDHVELDVTR